MTPFRSLLTMASSDESTIFARWRRASSSRYTIADRGSESRATSSALPVDPAQQRMHQQSVSASTMPAIFPTTSLTESARDTASQGPDGCASRGAGRPILASAAELLETNGRKIPARTPSWKSPAFESHQDGRGPTLSFAENCCSIDRCTSSSCCVTSERTFVPTTRRAMPPNIPSKRSTRDRFEVHEIRRRRRGRWITEQQGQPERRIEIVTRIESASMQWHSP